MTKTSKRKANLTVHRAVKSLKWQDGDPVQYEVKSHGHPGYYIRISKGGTRTWIYRYTFKGHVQNLPLGRYPHIGCAEAFTLYKDARELLKAGTAPLAQKKAEQAAEERESDRSAFTVSVLFHDHYWPRFATKKRTARNDWHYFTVKIEPVLGDSPADSVTPDEVERLIRPIEACRYPLCDGGEGRERWHAEEEGQQPGGPDRESNRNAEHQQEDEGRGEERYARGVHGFSSVRPGARCSAAA